MAYLGLSDNLGANLEAAVGRRSHREDQHHGEDEDQGSEE